MSLQMADGAGYMLIRAPPLCLPTYLRVEGQGQRSLNTHKGRVDLAGKKKQGDSPCSQGPFQVSETDPRSGSCWQLPQLQPHPLTLGKCPGYMKALAVTGCETGISLDVWMLENENSDPSST